jgi:hypothetical protein
LSIRIVSEKHDPMGPEEGDISVMFELFCVFAMSVSVVMKKV